MARDGGLNQILINNTFQNISDVTATSPFSWNNPSAVSAAYNLAQTYDYFWQRFGLNSYDGKRGNLVSVVRIGNLTNAFWNPQFRMMFFGNGDRYPGSLDVTGHEATHGVISSIGRQGVLDYQTQSGSLNEAFADIFGEMVEARTKGTNDWLMGSQLNSVVRSMANPHAYGQPDKMTEFVVTDHDNGGVHLNNGIINRAYFLLAAGLPSALGNRDAEGIFYRSLTQYLKPRSQFVDARLACIASAEDLFGTNSVQAIMTAEAFDAVEIYASPASSDQLTSVNAAVQAPDSAMFIRTERYRDWGTFSWQSRNNLCRREMASGDSSNGTSVVLSVKLARPTVSGDGSAMSFAGSDESLYRIQTSGSNFTNLNLAGKVHSVAVSPEGHYAAFVLNATSGVPTNQIVLIDLRSNIPSIVDLRTPVADGSPINNINHADSLDFSPDGKILIYDALSTLRSPDGKVREAWSIFALDMTSLQQYVIVPPDNDFQIGNPVFSQTSSRFLVFDAQYTNGISAVVTLDLYRRTLALVGVSQGGLGYPCFNGDDSYVIFADNDTSTASGRSIYAQLLSADKMSPTGGRVFWLNDAKLAVIYRRGTYPSVNTPPTVTLISPLQNTVFTAPASVILSASAGDIDGNVARMEFFSGSILLATDTAPPYTFTWANVPAGVYRVSARAYDTGGASVTSQPVLFTVKPAVDPGIMNPTGTPGFQFSLRMPQPGLYRLEGSTNLINWVPLGSFYCTTDLGYLDLLATNYPARFYRAVSTPPAPP